MVNIKRRHIVNDIINILCLLLLCNSQNTSSIIAIQSTNQTYISYVPLISCPLPKNSSIQPGSVNYTLLDADIIFQAVQKTVSLTFWEVIRNGISILADSESFLMNGTYSQLLYYNSSISDDFRIRDFFLTSFTDTGNIVMSQANAQYYSLGNITLNIYSNITTNLSQNGTEIVKNCLNQGKNLQIIYLGEDYFLALCPNTTDLFSFNPFVQNQTFIYNINSSSFQNIAANPILLMPNSTSVTHFWNGVLLATGGVTATFCYFNRSTVACKNLQQDISWIQTIAIRIWGIQQKTEQQQALLILSLFPQISQVNFQGSIISLYRRESTVYIQSILNEQTFLVIFDGNTLIVNTTLIGNVLYYGSEKLIVEVANGSLFITSFTLSYKNITNNGTQQTYQTISLDCDGYQFNQTFEIFWTNIDYPTSIVVPLKDNSKNSSHALYTIDLGQQFQVIGPAFQVFAMDDNSLTITLMSTPILTVTDRITAILQIQFLRHTIPRLPFSIYFFNRIGQYRSINSQGFDRLLTANPCGFNQVDSAKKIGSRYLIKDTANKFCLCSSGMKNCEPMPPSTFSTLLQSNKLSDLQRSQVVQMVHQTTSIYPSSQQQLKQQLYNMENQGIIINVYFDGQIDMIDLKGNILANLQTNCSYNATQGLILVRNFYDDFFFALCQGQNTITQYLIRNNAFIFNRIIPLWGFVIRPNGSWLSGQNYIFLEVDMNPTFFDPSFLNNNQQFCCVLRLDPNQFTVSVIAEIVQANKIVIVQSFRGVDIAYYNQTGALYDKGYLKVYFEDSWVSFDQNQRCHNSSCPPQTYQYNICFASLLYNFASSFSQSITFNTIQASINAQMSPISPIIFNFFNSSQYNAKIQFNFTNICGPISLYTLQYLNQSNSTFYELVENLISTRNKILNEYDSAILQAIDLDAVAPDSSFSNYIMIVTTQSVSLYNKFNGIWLDKLTTIDLPLSNCLFYVYSIQNDTNIQFGSNCYNLNIPNLLLTLSYQNQTSIAYQFANVMLPTQMRSIKSIPSADPSIPPFIFGLGQGPSKSITGLLLYCQIQCTQLLISTKFGFVIDFDVATVEGQLFVVGLDVEILSLWTSLPVPTTNLSAVEANFSVNYQSIINQACDLIQITNPISLYQTFLLLSCQASYFQISVNFNNSTIKILLKYQKFLNCELVDKSLPVYTLINGRIDILIVVCNQNRMMLRTKQYQTIASSNSTIVTAYLQIYVPQGPICDSSSAPIRVIPLAVTSVVINYLLYSSNGYLKLLYEQIDGLIIDSFIDKQPSANFSIVQLTKQVVFPKISLKILNPYYQISFQIDTSPMKTQPSIIVTYIVLSFFVLTNLITLSTLGCWFAFKRKKRTNKTYNSQYQLREMNSNSSDTSRQPLSHPTQNDQNTSEVSSPIASPLVKRATQIQLFQPRYKPV